MRTALARCRFLAPPNDAGNDGPGRAGRQDHAHDRHGLATGRTRWKSRFMFVERERMQYLLMCCFDEKQWEKIPESQRDEIMQEYGEFVQSIVKSGHYLAGAKLGHKPIVRTFRTKTMASAQRACVNSVVYTITISDKRLEIGAARSPSKLARMNFQERQVGRRTRCRRRNTWINTLLDL